MAVSTVNALMGQVSNFLTNQPAKGVQQVAVSNPEQNVQKSGNVLKADSVLHSVESEAYKVSFSSEALNKNQAMSAAMA